MLFSLNEDNVKDKTYVQLLMEDVFGMNNSILQTPEKYLKSDILLEKTKENDSRFPKHNVYVFRKEK